MLFNIFRSAKRKNHKPRRLLCESLENRVLLSAVPQHTLASLPVAAQVLGATYDAPTHTVSVLRASGDTNTNFLVESLNGTVQKIDSTVVNGQRVNLVLDNPPANTQFRVCARSTGDDLVCQYGDDTLITTPSGEQQLYASGATGSLGIVGDFNNDGYLDSLVYSGNQTIERFGDATGFGKLVISDTPEPAVYGGHNFQVTGDFNGDGNLDILTITSAESSVGNNVVSQTQVYLACGNGDGTFQAPRQVASINSPTDVVWSATAADFNHDGKLDLVVTMIDPCNYSGEIPATSYILLGKGDGTFAAPTKIADVMDMPFYTASGVLSADGNMDLVLVGLEYDTILLGNGDGTFRSGPQFANNGNSQYAIADFNGDGIADLAFVSGSNRNQLNIVSGGSFQVTTVPTPSGGQILSLAAGDFNADGNEDIAYTSGGSLTSVILSGAGNGTFTAQVVPEPSTEASNLYVQSAGKFVTWEAVAVTPPAPGQPDLANATKWSDPRPCPGPSMNSTEADWNTELQECLLLQAPVTDSTLPVAYPFLTTSSYLAWYNSKIDVLLAYAPLVDNVPAATMPQTTVTGVTSAQSASTYQAGSVIAITVSFSGPVTVTGKPQLLLNDGATATYTGGSGTTTLTFKCAVASGDSSPDLDYASTAALVLNGGSIKDALGMVVTLTLPATGSDGLAKQNIVIDAPPTVTSAANKLVAVGQKYTYQIKTNAGARQKITFSLRTAPAGMSINASTGLVTWVPNISQMGSSTVTVLATDQLGGTTQQTFSISVYSAIPTWMWRRLTILDPALRS